MATGLLTRTATKSALLTTTQLGIDTTLFKPVYLGRDAHTLDPWNAGDTIVAGPEGVVFARHRDQLAMREPNGRMPVYGYTIPYTSWSDSYGEARDRSNERSLYGVLGDKVRHVQGPAGTSHLLMIKAEGLLHGDAAALRELTALAKDEDMDHLYDELDYHDLHDEVFQERGWSDYQEAIFNEFEDALLRYREDRADLGEMIDRRGDDWLRREWEHTVYNIFEIVGCTEHSPFEMPNAVDVNVPHYGEAAWEIADKICSVPEWETPKEQNERHRNWVEKYGEDSYFDDAAESNLGEYLDPRDHFDDEEGDNDD